MQEVSLSKEKGLCREWSFLGYICWVGGGENRMRNVLNPHLHSSSSLLFSSKGSYDRGHTQAASSLCQSCHFTWKLWLTCQRTRMAIPIRLVTSDSWRDHWRTYLNLKWCVCTVHNHNTSYMMCAVRVLCVCVCVYVHYFLPSSTTSILLTFTLPLSFSMLYWDYFYKKHDNVHLWIIFIMAYGRLCVESEGCNVAYVYLCTVQECLCVPIDTNTIHCYSLFVLIVSWSCSLSCTGGCGDGETFKLSL